MVAREQAARGDATRGNTARDSDSAGDTAGADKDRG
jgi:hypothetical protein